MRNQDVQNLFSENAGIIIDHYSELVDQTRQTLFPWWKLTLVESPNLEGMRPSQAKFAEIAAPYMLLDQKFVSAGGKKFFVYCVWLAVLVFWMVLLTVFSTYAGQPATPATGKEPAPLNFGILILAWTILILAPLLLYGYTVWFLTTKRNTWKTRAAWLITLMFLLYYLYLEIQKPFNKEFLAISDSPAFGRVLLIIIIPAILLVCYSLLYFAKFLLELFVNSFNAFVHAHQPVSYQILREVITASVRSDKASWHLAELNINEINTLKELAKNNLEATEKKTIPTIILIAVVGFLATLPGFQEFLGHLIAEVVNRVLEVLVVTRNAPNMTLGRIIFDLAIMLLISFIFAAYLLLFQNLLVQGIIIQVCTIAEGAHKQTEHLILQDKKEKPIIYTMLQKLIAFIASMLRN